MLTGTIRPNSQPFIGGDLAYRITLPDGSVIECDTRQEALQLFRDLRRESLAGDGAASIVREDRNPWVSLAQALAAVSEAPDAGISSADLAIWIGLRNGNQLGPKARAWRRLLEEELRIPFDDVWEHREISRGHRRWFPKKKIAAALAEALRRAEPSRQDGE